jgi:glycosyltransferase involved in cell wall biosynthesis
MTRVIHNPIDASVFKLLPKKEARSRIKKDSKPPMILFVGKLIPRKGAHLLVEAVGRLRAKGQSLQLTIVGDGPQKRNLEVLIHEKELISSVFLEGPKSQAELIHYYNAADLFVLPSLMESFGLVFVEALLCGCPVIGTPRVLNELLPSEDYGYYTPPSDTLALADTIEKALSRSWDRAELSDYAFRTFNWEDRIKDFEQVYAEVVTLSS